MEILEQYSIIPYLSRQKWFRLMDNHVYLLKRQSSVSVSVTCHRSSCGATIKIKADCPINNYPMHNHEPDDWVLERNTLFHSLKERATNEHIALNSIYEEEASRYPLGAEYLLYESILPSMRKWRRSTQPAVPATLSEYARMIPATQHANILLGEVTASGASAVILGMPDFGRCLREADIVLADGTFNAIPAAPQSAQLLTIHTICEGRYFHPIIVVMQSRRRELYEAVFTLIRRLAGEPTPSIILTDYETALQAALAAVFPRAQMKGCYFHYAQALERRARQEGVNVAQDSPGGKMVKLYTALALLPPEQVSPALAELPTLLEEVGGQFNQDFDSYFRNFWIQRIGPEMFCVGSQLHRTTNIAEAYHKQLNTAVRRHPNIWELTAVLERKLAVSNQRFAAHRNGNLTGSRNFARYQVRRNVCRRLVSELRNGVLTLRQCLLRLSRLVTFVGINDAGAMDIGAEVEVHFEEAAAPEAPELAPAPAPPALAPAPAPPVLAPAPAAHLLAPGPAPPVLAPVPAQNDRYLCRICYAAMFDTALTPCGHTICQACAIRIFDEGPQTCPQCRMPITNIYRLYY